MAGFNLNGKNISQLQNTLNSQNAMGSTEAKEQAAANADPSQMHGLKGMFARAKEGSGFAKLKGMISGNKAENNDDNEKKKKNPFEDFAATANDNTTINPNLKMSSIDATSDAHLKDFFLACYTDNPYLKTLIKTKLMSEYFNK